MYGYWLSHLTVQGRKLKLQPDLGNLKKCTIVWNQIQINWKGNSPSNQLILTFSAINLAKSWFALIANLRRLEDWGTSYIIWKEGNDDIQSDNQVEFPSLSTSSLSQLSAIFSVHFKCVRNNFPSLIATILHVTLSSNQVTLFCPGSLGCVY